MREHLQHGAGEAGFVKRGQAEKHKSHVTNAGITDDVLEVGLPQGDEGTVDDVDHGDSSYQRGPCLSALGQQADGNA